eukprot:8317339-Pyramimonas_sp.AAC.1
MAACSRSWMAQRSDQAPDIQTHYRTTVFWWPRRNAESCCAARLRSSVAEGDAALDAERAAA